MSRIGNIHTIVFLSEDCGVIYPIYIMHRNSMALLEDVMINFCNSNIYYTILPITEILNFYFFNNDLNHYSILIK